MAKNLHNSALILTGGGARGAYQVGILSAIADHMEPGTTPFNVITGVSVGAINAASLTAGAADMKAAITKLEKLWLGLHTDRIYRSDVPAMLSTVFGYLGSMLFGWAGANAPPSILSNTPLRKLLEEEVDFEKLAAMVEGETLDAVAITASSYHSGMSVSFYHGSVPVRPWERSRRIGRPARIGPDHIMASSALPFVFPAVKIGQQYFGDGALRQIAPLSPAIHLGCDKLLVIGARDKELDGEPEVDRMPYPTTGVLAGQLMDIVFNDNLDADVERLKRINATLDSMMPERRKLTPLHHVDVLTIDPSEDVRSIAARHVHELPGTVKMLLRALGAWKAPWVLQSYLMFEPGYISALIDLGRKDARARMDDITEFLGLQKT